jgi:hypothetical protein
MLLVVWEKPPGLSSILDLIDANNLVTPAIESAKRGFNHPDPRGCTSFNSPSSQEIESTDFNLKNPLRMIRGSGKILHIG